MNFHLSYGKILPYVMIILYYNSQIKRKAKKHEQKSTDKNDNGYAFGDTAFGYCFRTRDSFFWSRRFSL
ncbi:MAG: hypothetical protein IJD42_00250 [Clostridia bacterium]|nr:hypothetical protein [Clostridia bacterium]